MANENKENHEHELMSEMSQVDEPGLDVLEEADQADDEEKFFVQFFNEVLKSYPKKVRSAIIGAYGTTRNQADKIVENIKNNYKGIFEEFLRDVDEEVQKKTYSTIHAAALMAAIVGLSPIPFSDAVVLVPIQLLMMARLHKLFGKSWSENIGAAITKELTLVTVARAVPGNLIKLIPVLGTVPGAAINSTVAATITYALGWVTVKMLNDGTDLLSNLDSFKNQYKDLSKAMNKLKE